MKYITDMHIHTSRFGGCASASAEETVNCYLNSGITSIVLTNHISEKAMNVLGYDRCEWNGFCDEFVDEANRAKSAADGSLNVLLGAEFRDSNTGSDYLIYGLDGEKLRELGCVFGMKFRDISARIHDIGCLVYQAHPFRNGQIITNPEYLDGIETVNFNYKVDSRNDMARIWAERMNMRGVCGSDFHHVTSAIGGGIVTDEPITDNSMLLDVLKKGNYGIERYRDERSTWKEF